MIEEKIPEDFKDNLKLFLEEIECMNISRKIGECESYMDLFKFMKYYSEELVGVLNYECMECDEKDDEISSLESDLNQVENDLYNLENETKNCFTPQTLDDVFKIDVFMENKDKYSVSEFEDLFLKKIK